MREKERGQNVVTALEEKETILDTSKAMKIVRNNCFNKNIIFEGDSNGYCSINRINNRNYSNNRNNIKNTRQ